MTWISFEENWPRIEYFLRVWCVSVCCYRNRDDTSPKWGQKALLSFYLNMVIMKLYLWDKVNRKMTRVLSREPAFLATHGDPLCKYCIYHLECMDTDITYSVYLRQSIALCCLNIAPRYHQTFSEYKSILGVFCCIARHHWWALHAAYYLLQRMVICCYYIYHLECILTLHTVFIWDRV